MKETFTPQDEIKLTKEDLEEISPEEAQEIEKRKERENFARKDILSFIPEGEKEYKLTKEEMPEEYQNALTIMTENLRKKSEFPIKINSLEISKKDKKELNDLFLIHYTALHSCSLNW